MTLHRYHIHRRVEHRRKTILDICSEPKNIEYSNYAILRIDEYIQCVFIYKAKGICSFHQLKTL